MSTSKSAHAVGTADAIVVGGGPAGLSAALYLARYNRSVLVFDTGRHLLRDVEPDAAGHGPPLPADYHGAMPGEPVRFPPEAVRDIRIRHVKQTGCGPVAIITVDFEPLAGAGTGVRLAVADDVELGYQGCVDHQELFGYLDAIAAGVREELADAGWAAPATRVVLRRIVIHPVDSSDRGFRTAGALAARAALERFAAPVGER